VPFSRLIKSPPPIATVSCLTGGGKIRAIVTLAQSHYQTRKWHSLVDILDRFGFLHKSTNEIEYNHEFYCDYKALYVIQAPQLRSLSELGFVTNLIGYKKQALTKRPVFLSPYRCLADGSAG